MLSYRSNCLGFVCLILLSLHVNVRGDEETGVQKAKAPKATALKAAIMDFKAVVENSPNAVAADSLGETQSQKLKAAIDQSAKEDRCRSLAYYTLGMHYFSKNAFDAASTNFAAAGNSIETTPGSKLMALQMQFLCLKNLGRTNETIELAGQIGNHSTRNLMRKHTIVDDG